MSAVPRQARCWLPAALLAALVAALLAAPVSAAGPAAAADAALEARVNQLAAELRCLVCQNQSLADSHAELAIDLKNQVREQLAAGRTEAQVIDYMTQRYGDFVLYRPPFKATTALLWGGPLLLVAAGLWLLRRALRAQRTTDALLDPDDQDLADALIGGAASRRPDEY